MVRILIVDESAAMQNIVSRWINDIGCTGLAIRSASCVKEALSQIYTWSPDIVLTEMHLTGDLSGIDLLRAVRQRDAKIKLGFLTSDTSETFKRSAQADGADFIVDKPFNFQTLCNVLLPHINPSQVEVYDGNPSQQYDRTSRVSLPCITSLRELITTVAHHDILVEQCARQDVKYSTYPYVLGVLETPSDNIAAVVAVLDFNASCVLGGTIERIDHSLIRQDLLRRIPSKEEVRGCNSLFSVISKTIVDGAQNQNLTLRSTRVVYDSGSSLNKLLSDDYGSQLFARVGVEGFDLGSIALIGMV